MAPLGLVNVNAMAASKQLRLLMVCLLAMICGCVSPPKNWPLHKYPSLYRKYEKQEYSDCLAQAERILARRLDSTEWAEVMLTKALCLEETGKQKAADDIYREIKTKNVDPKSATKARLRLFRVDLDQYEFFEMDFGNEKWIRLRKDWWKNGWAQQLHPCINGKPDTTRAVFLGSGIRLPQIRTKEDCVQSLKASMLKSFTSDDLHLSLVDNSYNDGVWLGVTTNKRGHVSGALLIRIVLTQKKMHLIVYAHQGHALSEIEQKIWIEKIKKCKFGYKEILQF